MTHLITNDTVARHIAEMLRRESFTLLDIGCSGGIHPAWRVFEERLRAVGFDPNIEEVERLRAKESLRGVSYEAAFVGVPDQHPLALDLGGRSLVQRTPWSRLSVARTLAIREEFLKQADNQALTSMNAWRRTRLAPREPVFLPDYIASRKFDDLDFVKIDIDGGDFIVLQSLFESPAGSNILGLMLEVNFHGTDDPRDNTFHNMDRFMRRMGFDLFDLSVRYYSSGSLPLRYEYDMAAQTLGGRPFQGDALYVRDLSGDEMSGHAKDLSDEKIAKAVAIFALSGHHDQAAELVVRFTDRLSRVLSPEAVLEMLAKVAQKGSKPPLSYREYMAAFERDDAMFYPCRSQEAETARSPAPPRTKQKASPGRSRRKPLLKRVKKWLRTWASGR